MHEQPLWHFLERLADVVLVALMTLVASLALVTALPALAAADAVLSDHEAGGPVVVRYARALRVRLRSGTTLSLLALPLLVVAGVDVMWSLTSELTPLRTAVLAAGVLLGTAVAAVLATAATDLHAGRPLRQVIARAGLRAAAAPHRALVAPVVAVAGAALTLVLPLAAPLVLVVIAKALPRPALSTTAPAGPGNRSAVATA